MCIHLRNAAQLARQAAAAVLRPSDEVDYLAWAKANIVFSKRESAFPGPYNTDLFPFFSEILRAMGPDDPCRIVTLRKSAQIGWTDGVVLKVFPGGQVSGLR